VAQGSTDGGGREADLLLERERHKETSDKTVERTDGMLLVADLLMYAMHGKELAPFAEGVQKSYLLPLFSSR